MTPRYLFSPGKDGVDGVLACFRSMKRAALFLDYDGTLVSIKKRPGLAALPERTREVLAGMSSDPRFFIAIVTGRTVRNIEELVDIKGINYIGNHGFETKINGKYWAHPEAVTWRPLMLKALAKIKDAAGEFQGASVEDKGLTLALHYRNSPSGSVRPLRKAVQSLLEIAPFRIVNGKKVFEVRPGFDWDKGKAVLNAIRYSIRGSMLLYAGDDLTDEDAFKALEAKAVTIAVGRKKKTAARYFLKNTREVLQLLHLFRQG